MTASHIENIVWINDEDEIFTKGELLETEGKAITCKDIFDDKVVTGNVNVLVLRNASITQFTLDKVYPYDQIHESRLAVVSSMPDLSVASLFYVVKTRFEHDLPYTRVFTSVIHVNPLKSDIDYESEVERHNILNEEEKLGHIYSVATLAIENVNTYNQSIILTGESGSGKTGVLKQLLPYICTGNVRTKVVAASNILEMFGNCQTRLNSNSSRFTRYIRVKFKNGALEGSDVMQVFLERGRVIAQPEGESSFHIFYVMFAAISGGHISQTDLNLDCNAAYAYIDQNSRILSNDHKRDLIKQYQDLSTDMSTIGIDLPTQLHVYRTLAAIVLLGNVVFRRKLCEGESGEGSVEDSECVVDPSCDTSLLRESLGVQDVTKLLTTKVIQGGRASSFYEVSLTGAQARANADALATGLYYKLFGWLTSTANQSTKYSGDSGSASRRLSAASNSNYVGILDMCGFEKNEDNSFEQLCVNYCNEKIYSVFFTEVFATDITLMMNEGCPHPVSVGYDNSQCLSLLDGEAGILRLIDEHCVLSRAGQDDSTLLALLCHQHPKHSHFDCGLLSRRRRDGETKFKVKHYCGTVEYSINGFMSSNSEKLEIEAMTASCANTFIQTLHALKVDKPGDTIVSNAAAVRKASMSGTFVPRNNRRNTKKNKATVCADVRSGLAAFVGELQTTELQFITCVKPNKTQSPGLFDSECVMEQLRANGVIDVMLMNTKGYTMNLSWKDLHETMLEKRLYPSSGYYEGKPSILKCVENIKSIFSKSLEPNTWFVGSSGRVYLKSIVFDELRRQKNHICARSIQSIWKVHRLSTLLHSLYVSVRALKRTLLRHVHNTRTAKALAELEEKCKKYSYLLLRWRFRMKIRKRTSSKVCVWFLRRAVCKANICRLISSQATICNFLQTKRLRRRFLLLKSLALVLQKYSRGALCRREVKPLIEELKQRLYKVKCRKSSSLIYGLYRNFKLREWIVATFYAVRWGDVSTLSRLLDSSSSKSLVPYCLRGLRLVNIRDFASGYSSMLHLAIENELVEMTRLLLQFEPEVKCYDCFGSTPLGNIPSPPISHINGEILGLLIAHCPDILFFPDRSGWIFSDYNEYQDNKELASIPCGSSDLGKTLKHLKWTSERGAAKAKHKEAMLKGSTIIPLYDPENFDMPLRECVPCPDDAHIDLNAFDEYESDELSESSSDFSESELENEEGRQLKEKVKDIIFTASPISPFDKDFLATARPISVKKNRSAKVEASVQEKGEGNQAVDGNASGPSLDGELVVDDASSITSSVGSLMSMTSYRHSLLLMPDLGVESSFLSVPAPSKRHNNQANCDKFDNSSREATSLSREAKKTGPSTPKSNSQMYSTKNDPKYRMLIAKRNALQKDPILQFFAETRLK